MIKKRKCHCATYIPTSNSQILIRELLKCNRLGSKISINYPLIGVIQDDGAGHRDAELVVVEVLVDIIQVRDVGPESSAALEHCTHHQSNHNNARTAVSAINQTIVSDVVQAEADLLREVKSLKDRDLRLGLCSTELSS